MPALTYLALQISRLWSWLSHHGRRMRNISCCRSSGCRKIRWSCVAAETMYCTMFGRNRTSSRRPKETSFIMVSLRNSSSVWAKPTSPPSKELFKFLMEGNLIHGGNPVFKWMAGNVVMRQDPAGNIKPDKEKSVEKIDGIVASIMALDRCIRNGIGNGSIYDEREIISF